jgi:hypothetical protein
VDTFLRFESPLFAFIENELQIYKNSTKIVGKPSGFVALELQQRPHCPSRFHRDCMEFQWGCMEIIVLGKDPRNPVGSSNTEIPASVTQ